MFIWIEIAKFENDLYLSSRKSMLTGLPVYSLSLLADPAGFTPSKNEAKSQV